MGDREKGGYRKVSQGSGKTVMKPITTPITSQIDSHETNEADSNGREEIIMEMSTIVTSSNKCCEKGKQVIRPILTIPILMTPMKLM
ncbi:12729_t:CDS:2 [Funneliformis geosporum]|nr:12729_t:CDS:2 [Funneliformis geosporum]